ncbi:hypothetical protein BKA82DRAFT_950760 [Pisolithus tinctorius]|uniref:PCI domain-containing protein n=1 Tax=Pisolithus tinctorius Marx 270 TaxID=870435 RepID=A0A0C3NTQ9_PISTI|nr:hypothetical protein BKA82DRAFT_950760 [Pisolithus tinctorius]KIO04265.1 hypothetical protein M404DRAFT_950760 [Pisolithus tinctorius Marx 270]
MTTNQALLDNAKNANPARAEEIYKQILVSSASPSNVKRDQVLRDQENAMIKLAELYRDQRNAQGLAEVITLSRLFMSSTSKAKTAKLICTLLNYFIDIPNSLLQFKAALTWIDTLLTELKKLDDKMILTKVHLFESRVYRGIGNLVKAKAALTSARTAANSIYCPPHLRAVLNLQSGILHAEDKDYTTAYSYFYNTFENMSSQDDWSTLNALKYILLCKVMLNLSEDVTTLLSIKLVVKYAQLCEIECMCVVVLAHQNHNLAEFEKVLRDYKDELSLDFTIHSHLTVLYDTLLEQNLLCIIESYSIIEIDYVAKQVGQGRQNVEAKLSQMILDKVFYGILDQGKGCLLVFDEPEVDDMYGAAIDTLKQVGKVMGSLYAKMVKIA